MRHLSAEARILRCIAWLGLTGFAMLCGLPTAAAEGNGVVVETGSPDALCPELTQTRAAVAQRLGAIELNGRRPWIARYVIGHAPEGSPRDFVRLELRDSEGALRLSRDLPLGGESCATMSEAIALVLDRYFRTLARDEAAPADAAWAAPTVPAVSPEPSVAPDAAARPAPTSGGLPAMDSETATASPPRRLAVGAEYFVHAPRSWPAAGLWLLTRAAPTLDFGAELAFDLAELSERVDDRAIVRARGATAAAVLLYGRRAGRLTGLLGPGAALRLEGLDSQGLDRSEARARAVFSASVVGRLLFTLRNHLRAGASGAIGVNVRDVSGQLYVDDQEVLRPALVDFRLGFGFGYVFFP